MAAVPPPQTDEQRRRNLAHANAIRAARGADRKMIKGGVLDARSILNSPSDDWKGAKIAVLLRCMPAVDRQKATTIIRTAKVSPSKTISGLSDDQRRRLLNLMEPYCP